MNSHSTRTAVIIGASSGIGEALANELHRAGWRLGLLARRLDRLEALRETLAPETVVRVLDVAQPDAAFSSEAAGTWSGFHRLPRCVAIVRPPTRHRKRFSRCISMAFGT